MDNLSKRMLMNVSMIPKGSRVADIGCDHGFVSIYLIKHDIADSVVAMDVAEGPLMMAKSNIEEAGLSDRIKLKLSDGLSELDYDNQGKPEADTVLIAGMGGHLAIRLIEDSLDKCLALKYLILQIQSDIEFVRSRITELGFIIDDEAMVLDEGKYYTAMRIIPNSAGDKIEYSDRELRYGPVLLEKRPAILKAYLDFKKDSYLRIIEGITNKGKGKEGQNRIESVKFELELIESCLVFFENKE